MADPLPLPVRLLASLAAASPALRRNLWRVWYRALARRLPRTDWAFMNYGYAQLDPAPAPALPLREGDEPDRHCIQLYHHLVRPVALAGREVLEVGSGRGGGCSFLRRYAGAASVVGVDFSPEAVALCERANALPEVSFRQGDAEALPFPACRFDAVVNVESSHCYGSRAGFFGEARRVLRPGGHFLWADLCPRGGMGLIRGEMEAAGFAVVCQEEITPNVARAMEETSAKKRALIGAEVPRALAPYVRLFAGVEGTRVYERLRRGEAEYHCAVLLRPGTPDVETSRRTRE